MERFDTVIAGAGAAVMFVPRRQDKQVVEYCLLIMVKRSQDADSHVWRGRTAFTNLYVEPAAYLSQNPHFCKSALARYTQ